MTDDAEKADLLRYLQQGRDALVWKLDGLGEYDIRRPLVRTGTSLLGLVKHVASVEAGYLGECFGRPFPEPMPWIEDDTPDNADMWATAEESREDIVGMYRRVWVHSNATVEALDLDAAGTVAWWPPDVEVTLRRVLVHLLAETHRHAGHGDIIRELIDGAAGHRPASSSLPTKDEAWWTGHRAQIQAAADTTRE